MSEPDTGSKRLIAKLALVGALLVFVPPFLVSPSPPFGIGVGVVLTLRAFGILTWVLLACDLAAGQGAPRALGLLALLGIPGLVLASGIGYAMRKRPRPRRAPTRFSYWGCLSLVLFAPILWFQLVLAILSTVVVPIVSAALLHSWPFIQFPFLVVVLVHPFSGFVVALGMARFMFVADGVRDRIRRPVDPAQVRVGSEGDQAAPD